MSRESASAGARRGHHQFPRDESTNQYVITESTHLCGYPGCGKRFRFKHDLLRHQTKVHGREPVRRTASSKAPNAMLANDECVADEEGYSEAYDQYGQFDIT
jgi:hypothetical protein